MPVLFILLGVIAFVIIFEYFNKEKDPKKSKGTVEIKNRYLLKRIGFFIALIQFIIAVLFMIFMLWDDSDYEIAASPVNFLYALMFILSGIFIYAISITISNILEVSLDKKKKLQELEVVVKELKSDSIQE